MTRKQKINLISISVVAAYFLTFVLMLRDDTCLTCNALLWTVFIVPMLTAMFMSYDGQPEALMWFFILLEMGVLFVVIRFVVALFIKKEKNNTVAPDESVQTRT